MLLEILGLATGAAMLALSISSFISSVDSFRKPTKEFEQSLSNLRSEMMERFGVSQQAASKLVDAYGLAILEGQDIALRREKVRRFGARLIRKDKESNGKF